MAGVCKHITPLHCCQAATCVYSCFAQFTRELVDGNPARHTHVNACRRKYMYMKECMHDSYG